MNLDGELRQVFAAYLDGDRPACMVALDAGEVCANAAFREDFGGLATMFEDLAEGAGDPSDPDDVGGRMEAELEGTGPKPVEVVAGKGMLTVQLFHIMSGGTYRGTVIVDRGEGGLANSTGAPGEGFELLTEGVVHAVLERPVGTTGPAEKRARALGEQVLVVTCNRRFAALLGDEGPGALTGRPLTALEGFDESVFVEFIAGGYELADHRLILDPDKESPRTGRLRLQGTVKGGRLTSLWGSLIETTGQARMERELVERLEAEKRRLAQELHDGVGGYLTAIKMFAEQLPALADGGDGAQLEEAAEQIVEMAAQGMKEARRVQDRLGPPVLDEESLAGALVEHAASYQHLDGVAVWCETDPGLVVEGKTQRLHLYRIAQEAVHNALRHGEPSQVVIRLIRSGDDLLLEVADDGRGFDVESAGSDGHGLGHLEQRARLVGGRFTIDATPGEGTTVRCRIPVAEDREGARSASKQSRDA